MSYENNGGNNQLFFSENDNPKIQLSFPKGTILPYVGSISEIPYGWHLCDGTDGTPNLRDRFLMGAGKKSVKNFVSAGLPNITGKLTTLDSDNEHGIMEPFSFADEYNMEGALKVGDFGYTRTIKFEEEQIDNNSIKRVSFDASWSNDIYGKSNTVQPPAYVVYYIIKIL